MACIDFSFSVHLLPILASTLGVRLVTSIYITAVIFQPMSVESPLVGTLQVSRADRAIIVLAYMKITLVYVKDRIRL